MKRKAQAGLFTLLFFDLAFVLLYAAAGYELVNIVINQTVASGNLVGLELFFVTTLHFWIWGGIALANVAFFSVGGGQ